MMGSSQLLSGVPALQGGLEGVVEEEVETPGGSCSDDVWSDALIETSQPLRPHYLHRAGKVGGPGLPAEFPLVLVDGKPDLEQVERVEDAGGDEAATDPGHQVLHPHTGQEGGSWPGWRPVV